MAVRVVKRRGKRRLVIDIYWKKPDGSRGRLRRDAEVQTLAAARAEDRRLLATLVTTGSPLGVSQASAREPEPGAAARRQEEVPSFGVVARQYVQIFAVSHLKPSTRKGYGWVIDGLLIPRLGHLPVSAVNAQAVREIDALLVSRKARPSTRRNVQSVLRSILCRYAVEAKILSEPPAMPRLPKVGTKVIQTLTTDDVKRLLAHSCPEYRVAFLLAAHAGLRAGEVRGLRWKDVDLAAGRLVVRRSVCRGVADAPKSGHERVVPLTRELRDILAATPEELRQGLVSKTTEGNPWGQFSLYKAFRSACRGAGLKEWRYHDLRHYFVTALFRAGVAARTVQELAGHAHLTTTQRYAHVVDGDLEDAMRRLEL